MYQFQMKNKMDKEQKTSNELLAQEINYIKERLGSIEKKLDEKYVSHETFDLTITSLLRAIESNRTSFEQADTRIIRTAMFFATPLYAAVIALLFKLFIK